MLSFRRIVATATLLLCGVFFGSAEASDNRSLQSPFIVDVWESGAGEQKLPQSAVIAITQTRDGYLWLGTLGGLVRFDGSRFTVFNKANKGLENRIVYLFEDSRSDLWVGTDTAGIILIKSDGEIRNFDLGLESLESRLVAACEDTNRVVWLLMADGRLAQFTDDKLLVTSVGCKTIIAEKDGRVLLGADFGLFPAPTPGQQVYVPILGGTFRLDFLLASRDGGFWRLADGHIQRWRNGQKEREFAYPWNPGITGVAAACEDSQGNLIVGTKGEGVFWFNAEGHATQISTEQGLSASARGFVLSLCMDREGNLWVGTDGGGLNRVKKRIFEVLPESQDWTVQSVSADEAGGLWIGTFGKGLHLFRDGVLKHFGVEQSIAQGQDLTNLYVRSVFVDRQNEIFFGPVSLGLLRVVGENFVQYTNAEMASPNLSISAIHQDRLGRLWFGTQDGLVLKDKSNWRKFTKRDGLTSNSVRAIVDDPQGNLWIGTGNGGLNCLSNGQFAAARRVGGTNNEAITALLFDHDGALWIGTDGAGLERLQNGRWSAFLRRDGLLSDSIGYLIEDTQSNLWMGSYAGVGCASIQALNAFAEKKTDFVPCRAFGTSECTMGSQPAVCLSRDGRLWFPTTKGLVSVNPAEIKPDTNRPPVVIESVLVETQEQNTNQFSARLQSVTIPPGKERLEIHYTSLNFSAPENVRFKYQLFPHESHWIDAGNNRVVAYSKLPPGEYQFRVVAFNEDPLAASEGATLAVIVLPAFWQTATFRILAALCLIGIVGGAIYYFSTVKLQRELAIMKQHEELERERSRIARDLHDQLGANLTQVALLGEMAEADKNIPKEVESHAQQIYQTARETQHALDEIVWAINPSNDTLEGLVNYACKYAQEYLELAGVSHRFEVPAQLPKADIAPDVRHNVFLAFKESVNNVVKHAHATSVWIRLHLNDDSFTLEVQDNGRGLPKHAEKTTRNGLRNMRKRMEEVGGSFSIEPAPQKGTVVRLSAPIVSS